jgi:hypothetical protein
LWPLYTSQPKSEGRTLKKAEQRNFYAMNGCTGARTEHTASTNAPQTQHEAQNTHFFTEKKLSGEVQVWKSPMCFMAVSQNTRFY